LGATSFRVSIDGLGVEPRIVIGGEAERVQKKFRKILGILTF
jgi:hypothetical protein